MVGSSSGSRNERIQLAGLREVAHPTSRGVAAEAKPQGGRWHTTPIAHFSFFRENRSTDKTLPLSHSLVGHGAWYHFNRKCNETEFQGKHVRKMSGSVNTKTNEQRTKIKQCPKETKTCLSVKTHTEKLGVPRKTLGNKIHTGSTGEERGGKKKQLK